MNKIKSYSHKMSYVSTHKQVF